MSDIEQRTADSRIWFADELLRRLAYLPETSPPGLALKGDWGADGHGGPGHQGASTDICGTYPGMVCFYGSYVHVGDAIYRIDRYHLESHQWEARWPD